MCSLQSHSSALKAYEANPFGYRQIGFSNSYSHKQKNQPKGWFFLFKWWRDGDSNPGYPRRYASFQDWCFQPLSHPSTQNECFYVLLYFREETQSFIQLIPGVNPKGQYLSPSHLTNKLQSSHIRT